MIHVVYHAFLHLVLVLVGLGVYSLSPGITSLLVFYLFGQLCLDRNYY